MVNIIIAVGARKFLLHFRKYVTDFYLGSRNLTDTVHPKILYNSYLERNSKRVSYLKRKFLEQKNRSNESTLKDSKLDSLKLQVTRDIGRVVGSYTHIPQNWMEDYEFYECSIDEKCNINSLYGTVDSTIPTSTVPCSGCGAYLHCTSHSTGGYIPAEVFKGRTTKELQTIICQRCHFLTNYSIALDVDISAESYVETISKIKEKFALAIIIIDLLDFPCSVWPNLQELLGFKRPIFIVGNKVDLLPRVSTFDLEHIKNCLMQEMVRSGFDKLNIKYVGLISAKTGYGIEELITKLQKKWKYNGDVYLMGCTNVGKSTLFNILINSDYCRPKAVALMRKATVCPWPGTTLKTLRFPILRPSDIRVYQRFSRLFSDRAQRTAKEKLHRDQVQWTVEIQSVKLIGTVGRTFHEHKDSMDAFNISRNTDAIVTLDERRLEFRESRWCYDTPGILNSAQITDMLTPEELLRIKPEQMILPRAFRLKPSMTVFLAGLARLDFVDYQGGNIDWIKIFVFTTLKQPVSITFTEYADDFYKDNLGNELLVVPCGTAERLANWPGLQCKSDLLEVLGKGYELSSDILLSSVGWVGISAPEDSRCKFRAWTPYARGIYMRTPALIPYANRLIGKKIRNSYAYNMIKPVTVKK